MPPAKRSTSRRRTTTRKSSGARKSSTARGKSSSVTESASIKRLNKSLDSVQDALTALRKDVSKDVSTGAKGLYRDLEKFVRDARRNSGRLSTALQKDVERLQRQLKAGARGGRTSSAPRRRTSSRKSTSSGRRTSTRASGRRSTTRSGRSSSGSRSSSGTRSRSRSR
jgi:hypothetical protein